MAVAKVASTKGNLLQTSRIRHIFPHANAKSKIVRTFSHSIGVCHLSLQRSLPLPLSRTPVLATLSRPLDFSPLVQLVQVLAVTRQKRRCTFFPHAALWTQRLAKGHVQDARTHSAYNIIHTIAFAHTHTHTHTHRCAPEHAETRELWLTRQNQWQTWEDARQATAWAQLNEVCSNSLWLSLERIIESFCIDSNTM